MISFTQRITLASVLIGLLLTGVFMSKAQAQDNTEAEITAVIENFARDYVALPETKNPQTVLRYMEQDLTYSIFVLTISGSSRTQRGAYDNFATYLGSLVRTDLELLKYDVSNINVTQFGESSGTATYVVNYETKETDGLWVKGKETVTMAFEKVGSAWKIAFYNIVQVEDEKYKGTCLCELFASQSEEGNLVVKTTIPNGRSYTTHFDNFEFRTGEGETLIKTGEHVFKRLANGQLIAVVEGDEIELGMVTNKRESVLAIIRKHLYSDSCARLRVN